MGYGGTRPKNCYTHLCAEGRESGPAHGHSLRTMARVLDRPPRSTVSRELARKTARGCPLSGLYGADACRSLDLSATTPAQTCGPLAVAVCPDTSDSGLLSRTDYGTLLPRVSCDRGNHLSAEPLSVGLYVLPRGALRSALLAALRQARRPWARGTDCRGQIPNMTALAERPAAVATRPVPGH